jgi:hypothetical protein
MFINITLFHLFWLPGECGLVSSDVSAGEQHTIGRDFHAGLHLNHITNNQLLERNSSGAAIVSSIDCDIILCRLLEQLLKLLFLDPVVSGRDTHNDGYCQENGGAFDPTRLPAMLNNSYRKGAGGCEKKDS